MKEGDKMEPRKSNEELLRGISEKNKILGIQKLENDENGNLLLDPQNPHHREWYENDEDYEVIEQQE